MSYWPNTYRPELPDQIYNQTYVAELFSFEMGLCTWIKKKYREEPFSSLESAKDWAMSYAKYLASNEKGGHIKTGEYNSKVDIEIFDEYENLKGEIVCRYKDRWNW